MSSTGFTKLREVNYNTVFFNFQVVFATPGMLHAGQSLQIFKKWAGNEKNMVSLEDGGMEDVFILMTILDKQIVLLCFR